MAHTKQVFSTNEIAHLWAAQSPDQTSARNPGSGNHSFRGRDLYSYTTVIARIVTAPATGATVALIATNSWGPTTGRHLDAARRATLHLPQLTGVSRHDFVDFDASTYRPAAPSAGAPVLAADDAARVARKAERVATVYRDRIASTAGKAARARTNAKWHLRTLAEIVEEANTFREHFAPALPPFEAPTLDAARERAKANARRDAAAAAKAAAEQRARDAERVARMRPAIDAWVKDGVYVGGLDYDHAAARVIVAELGYPEGFAAMALRVDTDEVVTTQGARVPAAHVARVARLMLRLIDRAEAYTVPPAAPIRIGHYELRSIDADGTTRVGCHTFAAAEVRRIARVLDARRDAATLARME